jgi:hypothetical protein
MLSLVIVTFKFMRRIFLLLLFFLYKTPAQAQFADSLSLTYSLGIKNTWIGEEMDTSAISIFEGSKYSYKRRFFSPVKVKYFSENEDLDKLLFRNNVFYFNLDSSRKVSAIIMEIKEEEKLVEMIRERMGDFTHKTAFITSGSSSAICKGWIKDGYWIMILSSPNLKLLVFYNGDKKSFLE